MRTVAVAEPELALTAALQEALPVKRLIEQYTDQGLYLCKIAPRGTPLGQPSPNNGELKCARGKHPIDKGWQESPGNCISAENPSELKGGWGVGVCHVWSRTCAIDCDDLEQTRQFFADHGLPDYIDELLNDSSMVQIVSGKPNRAKWLFRLPEGLEPLRSLPASDTGFEMRCATSKGLSMQDCLPPTIHPDTDAPYSLKGDIHNIPSLPDELLSIWTNRLTNGKPNNETAEFRKLGEGEGRNNLLTSKAGLLRKAGLEEDGIYNALVDVNPVYCDPLLPDGELLQIARSISRHDGEAPPQPPEKILEPCTVPMDLLTHVHEARPRLYGSYLFRKAVTVMGGAGGVGKSVLTIVQVISLCIGRDLLGLIHPDFPLKAPRGVLLLNNEDSSEELLLRIAAICSHYELDGSDMLNVVNNLHYQSGIHRQLMFAVTDPRGRVIMPTLLVNEIAGYVKANDLEVLFCDPLVSLHDAEENNNVAMNAVIGVFKGLAAGLDIGVQILHHHRKGGAADAVDDVTRGGGSIKDAVRVNLGLFSMTEADEKKVELGGEDRALFFQLARGKNNYGKPTSEAIWFKTITVEVPAVDPEDNESVMEQVGVPVSVQLAAKEKETIGGDENELRETIMAALGDVVWPVPVKEYVQTIGRSLCLKDRATIYGRLECFPLIRDGKGKVEQVEFEGVVYRIWREKLSNKDGLYLHREATDEEASPSF